MNTQKIGCYPFDLPDYSTGSSGVWPPWTMGSPSSNGVFQLTNHTSAKSTPDQFSSQASVYNRSEHYYQPGNLPVFSQLSVSSDGPFQTSRQFEDALDAADGFAIQPVFKYRLEDNPASLCQNTSAGQNALKRKSPLDPFHGIGASNNYPIKAVPLQTSSVIPVSARPVAPSKTRIRWSQDLHERFLECVTCLGGADKATPKGILKLMDTDGLTIFHIKSHLQKYRLAKYLPNSGEGKSDKKEVINDSTKLDQKTGMQITEALRLQLDVQMRLHEQLEIQRKLQVRIEEQGKQLKKMFDQQQLFETQNMDLSRSEEPKEPEDTSLEVSKNTRL